MTGVPTRPPSQPAVAGHGPSAAARGRAPAAVGAGAARPERARPSRRGAALLGTLLVVVLLGGLVIAFAAFTGAFGSSVTVDAVLPPSANAVAVGNPVDYRDIQVGSVAAVDATSDGGVLVVMHIDPSELDVVPADVHATALPLSIFGTQYIDLQASGRAVSGTAHLVADQTIEPQRTSGSSSLQTTIANFDDLLTALHPADLAAAFDALATALSGQGKQLGATLASSAAYLGQLLPHLPQAEQDLGLLGQVGTQLAALTPALLATIGHTSAVASTITADQGTLRALLADGPALASAGNGFLQSIAVPYQQVATDITPLLQDVDAHPTELSQVLAGFTAAAQGFTQAASHGPYLAFTATTTIADPSALVLAGLGLSDSAQQFEAAMGASAFNPAPYTTADCPRYGSWAAPDCSGAGAASSSRPATGATPAAATPAAVSTQPAGTTRAAVTNEAAAAGAVEVARALDGRTPPSPAAADLLLDPLLAQMAGVTGAGGTR